MAQFVTIIHTELNELMDLSLQGKWQVLRTMCYTHVSMLLASLAA